MTKQYYPLSFFRRKEIKGKAVTFGLIAIENEDLTVDGLLAKMKEWDEKEGGVEAFVYDLTEKQLKANGSEMPKEIRRM